MVSSSEAEAWGRGLAPLLSASLDGRTAALQLDGVEFPAELREIQLGTAFPALNLSAAWPQDMAGEAELLLINRLDEKNAINWFGVSALEPTAFRDPAQRTSRLSLSVVRNRDRLPDASGLLAAWDSNTPTLQMDGSPAPTATPAAPSAQEMLIDLVRQERFSPSLYLLALGISLVLGALHALTPGHGKTVVAAYLVGARGTTRHAVVLGSVVTLTHTGSVLLLGLITLVASRYILPTSLIPALEVLSGVLIVGLGIYLLSQRLSEWRHARAHRHGNAHTHDHEHGHSHGHTPDRAHPHDHERPHDHEHGHAHGHTHEVPDTLTWRSLITLGVSGGLVPCPDAIAILLVAVAINRILLGLALIVAFSLGLAAVLIAIGLVMVHGRRLFDRLDSFSRFAPAMPVVSATVVTLLGVALTFSAGSRLLSELNPMPAAVSLDGARIIFLADDPEGHPQLFLADSSGRDPQALTSSAQGVIDYALSPDETQLVYFAQTDDSAYSIWLATVDGAQDRPVATCASTVCRQPIWSPDGRRVIFEGIDLGDGNSLIGVPTFWWLDVISGDIQPVFQQLDLPALNPRWSPDGQWLSFATSEGVRLYQLETGESHTISNRLGSAASWASDNRTVYLRDIVDHADQSVTQLFRYELPTQQRTAFNADLAYENLLVEASPIGDWVAVARREIDRLDENQIWLVRSDGSEAHQLAHVQDGSYSALKWSPDGAYLLCAVSMSDPITLETRLQIINVETGEVRDVGPGTSPSWVWGGAAPASTAR